MTSKRLTSAVLLLGILAAGSASAAQEPGCLPGPLPHLPSRQVSELDGPPPIGPGFAVRYCSAAIGRGTMYNVPDPGAAVAPPPFALRVRS